jgi:hypothetical protein
VQKTSKDPIAEVVRKNRLYAWIAVGEALLLLFGMLYWRTAHPPLPVEGTATLEPISMDCLHDSFFTQRVRI